MKTPNLSRRLTLEAPQDVADTAGGYDRVWMPMGEHYAQITASTGRTGEWGTTTLAEVPSKVVVRATPVGSASRPLPEQRFREGDRLWRILAVTEMDAKGHYLTCQCIEEAVA